MPLVRSNGTRLNAVRMTGGPGVAEDLVLVHGLATNMAFWYFQYASALAARFRVTLYDLRGHGRSETTPDGYAPENLSRDLEGLLDALGIERAHFLVHSYGGVVALNLAQRSPERVQSLVLCDTHISAARRDAATREWAWGTRIQHKLDASGLALDARDPYFGYRLLTEVARLQVRGQAVPPVIEELVGPLLAANGSRTASKWLELMENSSAERELMGDDGLALDRLRELRFPIFAMYGDHSQARLTGEELLGVWPHARFRRVRGAGHFFPTTRVAEVLDGCSRFWRGDFAREARLRAEDGDARPHFRSDRVYRDGDSWHCLTREGPPLGPFASADEAADALDAHVTSMMGLLPT